MAQEARSENDDPFDPVDSLSLDEALSIVGEGTRARIVVELGEAIDLDQLVEADDARSAPEDASPGPLSYSELMEHVGATDSGRFNYHLDKLVDTFVAKVDGGYVLRPPGHFLYRAIVAGTLTDRGRLEPFEVDDCPYCGEPLTARYPSDHVLYVRCPACEAFLHMLHLPTRGLQGRSREGLVDAAVRKNRHEAGLLRQGICHACSAPVRRALRTDGMGVCHCDYDVYAAFSCSACSVGVVGHPAHAALTAPSAIGFFAERGRDALSVPPWDPVVADAEDRSRIVGEDPLAVSVPFDLGDERLEVVLDDRLQVTETKPTRP